MMLSTVPDVFINGTPRQVEEHMHSLLRGLDTDSNLVLMIAPPIGTPIDNLRCAVKILTGEYGIPLNRSKRFGNILDLEKF